MDRALEGEQPRETKYQQKIFSYSKYFVLKTSIFLIFKQSILNYVWACHDK